MLPGLTAEATVIRDRHGTPHIYASTLSDLGTPTPHWPSMHPVSRAMPTTPIATTSSNPGQPGRCNRSPWDRDTVESLAESTLVLRPAP